MAQGRTAKGLLGVVLTAFLGIVGLVAQAEDQTTVAAADISAIRAVIEKQIEAFRRDDGTEAFSYAAPSIQKIFGTPDVFMRMVREGYEPVYRPQAYEFRDLVAGKGAPMQPVFVIGPNGVPVLAMYQMQKQPDGSWRISGCTLVRTGDGAA